MKKTKPDINHSGSSDTFKALGIPRPEVAKIKSDIALAIYRTIQDQDLTQNEAAELMGVDQAKVSAISRGITKGYSIERLLVILNRLDVDVNIRLSQKPRRRANGRTTVTFA